MVSSNIMILIIVFLPIDDLSVVKRVLGGIQGEQQQEDQFYCIQLYTTVGCFACDGIEGRYQGFSSSFK